VTWDETQVRAALAAIVADAEGAVADGVWPTHPLDLEEGDPPAFTGIYLGSAGIAWALRRLGSRLDLGAIVDRALERFRASPDFADKVPSLFLGESGILLVARTLGGAYDEERLRALVMANERNSSWELLWGSPGTALAARIAGLEAAYARSVEILVEEADADGLWTSDIGRRPKRILGAAHGFAGTIHALRAHVGDTTLRAWVERVLRAHAVREDGVANWPPAVGDEPTRVQWCHGAPGIVATIGDLMPADLMLAGAELTWRTGPLEKGAGLCHGTAGNGYALLRAYELTGDELWLERARTFALAALDQVERAREDEGRGRYSLLTGDVGAALFAQCCLDGDARFPIMDVV
jgi:Lanthionine synthetase C-like protein